MSKNDPFDIERKHLEVLLKDRINFYLVFSSLFLLGAVQIETSGLEYKKWIFLAGSSVSLLMGLAIVRTTILVQRVLKKLEADHPYKVVKKCICFPPNANYLLVIIPFILTGLFVWMAILEF